MDNKTKIKCFEFLILEFLKWGKSYNIKKSSYSKLKLTKLLFFVSAVGTNEFKEGLLSIFNNFWAMPLGHVESDVYKSLNDSLLFEITKDGLEIKKQADSNYFEDINIHKSLLLESIEKLKELNPDIINFSAFELVELSHKWQSWQSIFSLAKQQGLRSMKIPSLMIKLEPKFFYLETEA